VLVVRRAAALEAVLVVVEDRSCLYSRERAAPVKFLEDQMASKLQRFSFSTRLLVLALSIAFPVFGQSDEKLFGTPDQAGSALLAAAQSRDQTAVITIFGPDSREIISSGDPVQDKAVIEEFVRRYEVMHRWRQMADGVQTLLVGADNFAFPIPLKRNADGQWFFDTAAGKQEILNRRIGRNELAVIEACRAAADAQAEYHSRLRDGARTKQFAMKFISDPGRQNGLYWKSSEGQPQSPLGPLAAFATSEGYSVKPDSHTPFHGYYFHMLTGQTKNAQGGARGYIVKGKMVRGFAFVAYPAEYGNSGVMTFIINQDGVLFQKDLGKTTTEMASNMSKFDPDASAGWKAVELP